MTASTVDGSRGGGAVTLHRVGVTVVMAVEVGGMAGNARPAIATVNPGVAVAVGAINASAVDIGMTHEAAIAVHSAHGVAKMAGDTEGGGGNG